MYIGGRSRFKLLGHRAPSSGRDLGKQGGMGGAATSCIGHRRHLGGSECRSSISIAILPFSDLSPYNCLQETSMTNDRVWTGRARGCMRHSTDRDGDGALEDSRGNRCTSEGSTPLGAGQNGSRIGVWGVSRCGTLLRSW